MSFAQINPPNAIKNEPPVIAIKPTWDFNTISTISPESISTTPIISMVNAKYFMAILPKWRQKILYIIYIYLIIIKYFFPKGKKYLKTVP